MCVCFYGFLMFINLNKIKFKCLFIEKLIYLYVIDLMLMYLNNYYICGVIIDNLYCIVFIDILKFIKIIILKYFILCIVNYVINVDILKIVLV